MKKIAVILLLSFYGSGTILLPQSDFTCMLYLSDMYEQCRVEDPDINPADFVFEHLMNLEDLVSHFEAGEDTEEELPHQPFQAPRSGFQVVIALSLPVEFECRRPAVINEHTVYPLYNDLHIASGYLGRIFHPPLV